MDVVHFDGGREEEAEEVAAKDEWDDGRADAGHGGKDPDGEDEDADAEAEPRGNVDFSDKIGVVHSTFVLLAIFALVVFVDVDENWVAFGDSDLI